MEKTKKRIAVLEDDTAILQMVKNVLEEEYEPLCFSEAASFRAAFHKAPFPDLVLVDLWLDGENGQDVIPFLKAGNETKHIPIVVVSASSPNFSELKKLGADDMLRKPFEIAELLQLVKKYT